MLFQFLTIFSMNCNVHSIPDLDIDVVCSILLLLSYQSICNKRFVSFVIIVTNNYNIDVYVPIRIGSGNGLSDRIRWRRRCRGLREGMSAWTLRAKQKQKQNKIKQNETNKQKIKYKLQKTYEKNKNKGSSINDVLKISTIPIVALFLRHINLAPSPRSWRHLWTTP